MDIKQQFHLRTFVRPSLFSLTKYIGLALLIHSLAFIYWQPLGQLVVAETPNWINIKLISETEEKTIEKNKDKNITEINEPKIKSKVKTYQQKSEFKKQEKVPVIEKKSATTLVKANSRPYSLENPKPVYPSAARRRGMQGIVLLSLVINKKGMVDNISVERSSGFKVLDRSAVKSVKQWRFMPASRGGLSISSVIEIPIKFILDDLILK